MKTKPNKKGKKYNCPYCVYRDYRINLIEHVEDEHEDLIPKGYSPSRVVYNAINKKDHGTCMICKKETEWDESKQRYNTLCGNPRCKSEYVKIVRSRMVKKYGTYNLLNDPEFQKKMLENRSISGKYKFQDGGSIGYVGSYEKKFLEFMDQFLHIKSYDIISPGPTIPYIYGGKEHTWITDFLYEPYNLVFDIKDGGDNPNTRDMKSYREKQIAKEKAIAEQGEYNYIRLTDNKFEQLISIFMELKENVEDKPLIRINEAYIYESSSNKTLYHLSQDNLDGKTLSPRIPSNFLIKNGYEDGKTKRVCFAKSIDGSLRGMSQNLKGIKLYVHIPEKEYNIYNPTPKEVPDCKITGEVWIKEPVKLKCIGQIEIIKDKGEDGIPYKYGNNIAELFDWDWKWIEKIDEAYMEETRIPDDKLPKHIYHISSVNHNGETFEPRKYNNDNVKNDMERYVSRVCFSDSIQGCLYSIFPNGAYDADFYVHVPAHDVKVYSTTKDDIYDSEITHELWVKEPVEMKCIGKIHVSGVSNKETKTIIIDSDKVPYNKKKYHKCIWNWVAKYYKDQTLFENCIYEGKAINKCKYKECPECGSKEIGVFIQGEPIYKCKNCGKYLGDVPFE